MFPSACYPHGCLQSVPFVGALDGFTADLTVVVDIKRRLLSSYTGKSCLVRADRTGQPETEIGSLANGDWDEPALMSFAGTDSVYLARPYDQFGGLDFTQVSSKQPRLVNAGTLETYGAWFNGSSHALQASVADILEITGATSGQCIMRCRVDSTSGDGKIYCIGSGDTGNSVWLPYAGSYYWHWSYVSSRLSGGIPGGVLDTLTDLSFANDSNAGGFYVAGTSVASGTEGGTIGSAPGTLNIFSENGSSRFVKGWWSSFVMWKTGTAATAAARNAALA